MMELLSLLFGNTGLLGLIFFFLCFVCIAIWSLLPGNKDRLEAYKTIPLSEEPHE